MDAPHVDQPTQACARANGREEQQRLVMSFLLSRVGAEASLAPSGRFPLFYPRLAPGFSPFTPHTDAEK